MNRFLLLPVLSIIVLVSGCIEETLKDPNDIARENLQVKAFLSDHPYAAFSNVHMTSSAVSQDTDFTEHCQGVPASDYYKVSITDSESPDMALVWLDLDGEVVVCVYVGEEACSESWSCTDWAPAVCPESGIQTCTCTDSNACGTEEFKPAEVRNCTHVCSPDWNCTEWSACQDGLQNRTCEDLNNCDPGNNVTEETQNCSDTEVFTGNITHQGDGEYSVVAGDAIATPNGYVIYISGFHEHYDTDYMLVEIYAGEQKALMWNMSLRENDLLATTYYGNLSLEILALNATQGKANISVRSNNTNYYPEGNYNVSAGDLIGTSNDFLVSIAGITMNGSSDVLKVKIYERWTYGPWYPFMESGDVEEGSNTTFNLSGIDIEVEYIDEAAGVARVNITVISPAYTCEDPITLNEIHVWSDGAPVEGQYYLVSERDYSVYVSRILNATENISILESSAFNSTLWAVKLSIPDVGPFGPAEDEPSGAERVDFQNNTWTKQGDGMWTSPLHEGTSWGDIVIDVMPGGIQYEGGISADDRGDIEELLELAGVSNETLIDEFDPYSSEVPIVYEIEDALKKESYMHITTYIDLNQSLVINTSQVYDDSLFIPCIDWL